MHRFFIPPEWIQGQTVILRGETAHQIGAVLRMSPDDQIMVLDNQGAAYHVQLTDFDKKSVAGNILAQMPADGEPQTKITLFQAMPKKDKFEWILQKGTEIGVSAFIPMETARTIPKGRDKGERWGRILTEAAEQSRRGRIPTLSETIRFGDALEQLKDYDLALIAWEDETQQTLKTALRAQHPASVAVMVGPEGGFSAEEAAGAARAGAQAVTLGERILRTETAAIIAPALILHELES